MKFGRRAFTLIELLVVIVILAVVAAILLPSLSAARKRALRSSMSASGSAPAMASPQERAGVGQAAPQRTLATVKSFAATVSLKPGLSVGTADPESIYTAQFTSKFQAFNPAQNGECEVSLPLPPQIISLAELEVTVNSRPSESVEIRGGKLVWFGTLPGEPSPMSIAYSAVGKGIYNLQTPTTGILDTFPGAYSLMYFAQEFIPLTAAIFISSAIVLLIIAIRTGTIMGFRMAFFGTVVPAMAILSVTLVAAIHTRLQGILITCTGIGFFIVAMLLIPRLKAQGGAAPIKIPTSSSEAGPS